MDFEERLRRQVERHEALAQSLELLTADVRELQIAVRRQGENIDKLTIETAAQQQTLGSVLAAMQELNGMVAGHKRRNGRLESD